MARVTLVLPRVLCDLVGCERRIAASGRTLRAVLADLVAREPRLARHIFDENGRLRRHVLCICNGIAAHRCTELDRRVHNGDTVTLLGSVAGG